MLKFLVLATIVLQKGIYITCITQNKKEVKVNTTIIKIQNIIFATIEINKSNSCYIWDETKIRARNRNSAKQGNFEWLTKTSVRIHS